MSLKKLYPPQIEGTIPAFCGDKIVVPYSMNKTVSSKEVGGFALKIKTVTSNQYIAYVESNGFTADQAEFDIGDFKNKLNIGQHYKVQLAYINKEGENQKLVGYYSTIGVIKYTAEPQVYIEGLTSNINQHIYDYIGVYKIPSYQVNGQTVYDTNEKVYSHHFTIEDKEHNVIYQTEELIHQGINDDETDLYTQHDSFSYTREFEEGMSYYIQYTVTTMNNMVVSSPKYRLMEQITAPMLNQPQVNAELNFENGYIKIYFTGPGNKNDGEDPMTLSGAFKLLRSDETSDYTIWNEVARLKMNNLSVYNIDPIYDFTIEQGVHYKYALQQFSDNGMVSEKLLSNEVMGDFEDLFLYDGEKQLKVKYNPKVTSFKNTRMEAKVDTIGSKYPFIFRNGNVEYKEMPISGLISYHMDNDELFMKQVMEPYDVNLTSENIVAERNFKLAVMEWLENGKPKLFRSPGEGNYIVRLLNNSLSPNDTLGRMLHTFSCTAYEIADYTYENLLKYGFARVDDINKSEWQIGEIYLDPIRALQKYLATLDKGDSVPLNKYNEIISVYPDCRVCFQSESGVDAGYTVKVSQEELKEASYKDGNILPHSPATGLEFTNMQPGDKIYLDDEIAHDVANCPTGFWITIGRTGQYIAESGLKISKVICDSEHDTSDRGHAGKLTFFYEAQVPNQFEDINNVTIQDIFSRQIIGPESELFNKLVNSKKYFIPQIYFLRFKSRPLYENELYWQESTLAEGDREFKIYTDVNCTQEFTSYTNNKLLVYEVTKVQGDEGNRIPEPGREKYYEYKNGKLQLLVGNYMTGIYIEYNDERNIQVRDSSNNWTMISDFDNVKEIQVNNGTMVEISYQLKITDYSIEESTDAIKYGNLINARDVYDSRLIAYQRCQEQLESENGWGDSVIETNITNLRKAEMSYLVAKNNYLSICDEYIGKEVEL